MNLGAIGNGIGGFMSGFNTQQDEAQKQQMNAMRQQQLRETLHDAQVGRIAKSALGTLFGSGAPLGGLSGGLPGSPTAPPMPGQPSVPDQQQAPPPDPAQQAYAPHIQPQQGGQTAGQPANLLPNSSGPLTDAQIDTAIPIIRQDESGGRNVMQTAYHNQPGEINPSTGTHTGPSDASGQFQYLSSTWKQEAPKAGVDIKLFPTAMSAPPAIQEKVARYTLKTTGTSPWAPYNKKLAGDLTAAGIPGGGGGGQARGGQGAPQQQQTAAPTSPPPPQGYDLTQLARQIKEANPGIEPEALFAAVNAYSTLMNKNSQQAWERFKFQVEEEDKHLSRGLESRRIDEMGAYRQEQQREHKVEFGQRQEDRALDRDIKTTNQQEHKLEFDQRQGDRAADREQRDRKMPPDQVAMRKYIEEHPDAKSTDLAAFAQSSKGSRSPQQLVMQKWLGEHPGATSQDALQQLDKIRREQALATAFAGGTVGQSVMSLNTVTDHLDVLSQAAAALGNGDVQTLNSLKNRFQTEFGSSVPTTFEEARRVASNEIARATIGGVGGSGDREAIAKLINDSQSPQQLADNIAQAKRLIAGRMRSLRRGYAGNDPERQKQFDEEFMSPNARAELGSLEPEGGGQPGGSATGGATATGPNGQKLRLEGGKWVPVQ